MIYYKNYIGHSPDIVGKRKKVDNTIYSFDIETTSYLILDGEQRAGIEYQDLTKEEQERCEFHSCMYIWMFSINEDVYYGRTWDELIKFLDKLEESVPYPKIVFIHNQSFEFQFLKSVFNFTDVLARKSSLSEVVLYFDTAVGLSDAFTVRTSIFSKVLSSMIDI